MIPFRCVRVRPKNSSEKRNKIYCNRLRLQLGEKSLIAMTRIRAVLDSSYLDLEERETKIMVSQTSSSFDGE